MAGLPPFTADFDHTQWRALQADLKRFAPETKKALNKELRNVGGVMVAAAKSNASWSSRIPGAISLSVTSTRIGLKASRRKAPHARPYEGGIGGLFGGGGSFRHPVFGNRSVWVNQQARPFLAPAVRANQEEFFEAAADAVQDAARATGWH